METHIDGKEADFENIKAFIVFKEIAVNPELDDEIFAACLEPHQVYCYAPHYEPPGQEPDPSEIPEKPSLKENPYSFTYVDADRNLRLVNFVLDTRQ